MSVSERSLGNLLLCVLAAGLIGGSFLLPWFTYDHSTGRRTPEGGFHDPSEDGVVRQDWEAGPGGSEGTLESEHPAKTARTLDRMAWALYGALGLLGLAALSEIPGISRVLVRPVTLALNTLAFAAVAAALALGWYVLPESFGHGVDGPFTSYLDDSGYTMTSIAAGWPVAALSLGAIFGGFLLKFQAGAPDATAVAELYARGEI
ncbi:MAG: hypothetical protein AABY18_00215 [Candidatus Thermoplasmatota archaeon]